MNLSAFCIKRPAFTTVMSLMIIILGIISYTHLPVRWIPNISPPDVTISTIYPGANAKLVEKEVTKVIEDGLSGINGVEMLTSSSRQGESQIELQFKLGKDMDAAVLDVRSSLERIKGMLPYDIQSPVVMKADPDSNPILYISFSDPLRSDRELSDYVDRYVKSNYETIDGVGTVWVYGRRVSALQVLLDPDKMAAANMTAYEISELLRQQNTQVPSGQIKSLDRYYSVVSDTQLKSVDAFNNLIVKNNNHQLIRLNDIGEAKLDVEDSESSFRINGKPAIALGIVPQSTANPLDVERMVKQKFFEMKRSLPQGMNAEIIFDQADFIRDSITSVYHSFLESIAFVWLVIMIFLCSWRATIIPILTIPVCMIGTFTILYLLNFSINTITLMAFVLAIGLVVDDAIVMLENISRHIEKGLSPLKASFLGSKEILFPIIAMTITLAAVYAPIAFTPGLIGVLFREFTFTLAGAVILSGFVALTLTPMMCAKILKGVEPKRTLSWQTDKFKKIQNKYKILLTKSLQHRNWIFFILLLIGIIGGSIYKFLPKELTPLENMNHIYVSIATPRNSSAIYTDKFVTEMEKVYEGISDINAYLSINGTSASSRAFQIVMLNKNHREFTTNELIDKINNAAKTITGARINVFPPPPPLQVVTGSDEGDRLSFVLMTSDEYRSLQQISNNIVESLKENRVFSNVFHSLRYDSDQLQVMIDLNKAADLKVPISMINQTLSTLIAGKKIGKVDDMNILLKMNQNFLSNPNIIPKLYVRNEEGKMISLNSLLSVNQTSTSEVFKHYSRLRADNISLALSPNYNIADGIKTIEESLRPYLSHNLKYTFSGEAKNFLESNGKSFSTFLLALIFIYLVLVAQFESFIDPFIILLSVPFSVIGAFIALKLFNGSINIYSNIGLITLIGLVTKHGILIVDFANRLRMQGVTTYDAVIEAATMRLRPIIMTTAAMILGALPLALAFGPGSESRQQVGLVVAGGLLFGTIFSLIIVPIVYTYFSHFRSIEVCDEPLTE